jgi:hypothetical protein
LRLSDVGQQSLASNKEICTIHYENGPLLGPGPKNDIQGFEPLAAYETEIRENGAPIGVMKGTTAIARGKFGKGKVVCFSPHPEKTPGREPFLQIAVSWSAGLASMVGTEVVFHGRCEGPDKFDYFITVRGEKIYLEEPYKGEGNSLADGTSITVRGKLQHYIPPVIDQTKFEQPSSPAIEHYFIESPEIALAPQK